MSRHRNVRNMIADEDLYNYDDDDYYDEYDGYGGAAPMVAASQKKKKKKKKNANNNNNNEAAGGGGATAATATTATSTNTIAGKASAAAAQTPGTGGLTVLPTGKGVPSVGDSITASSAKATTPAAAAAPSSTKPDPKPVPAILLEKKEKPSLTCVILGHVDAGKSTLTGQLLWGAPQQQSGGKSSSNNNNRRPPANLAWLLDEDEEERKHGVTMEVATKVLMTPKYEIVLNDAPGHADYVPSMITGTASSDAAVVVVDATDFGTSFRAGQLREHLFLAKGLGIQQLIVAINKMDLLAWSEDAYQDMKTQLQIFLQGLGYQPAKLHFIPLSGLTGVNVFNKPAEENVPELTSWYNGPTLWQTLDRFDPPPAGQKLLEKPLRMIVTDVVAEQGKGVAVRTKVVSGWLAQGELLVVSPVQDETVAHKMTRVQSLDAQQPDTSNNNERDRYAVCGDLLDMVLSGLDINRISTGNILARPGLVPPLTTRVRAKIFVLEGLTIPIILGAQTILHMHYLDVPSHLSMLLRTLKPNGATVLKERPRVLTAKTQAIVEITLHLPIVMEAFSDCRALGRFVLRRSGASIAVGRVEEVF